jgi:hypothetical protein
MVLKHRVVPALLALAAAGCGGRDTGSAASGVVLDVPGWRMERAASVGGSDAGENEMLYQANEVYEDPEGRFYVINFGDRRIQVFDSAGTFLRNVGRKGKGPGEFTSPMSVAAVGADGLWVLDGVPARFIRYRRSTGEYAGDVPFDAKQLIPLRMLVGRDGRVAVEFMSMLTNTTQFVTTTMVAWVDTTTGRPTPVVQFDSTAKLRHNQRTPTGTRSMVTDPPFAPRAVWAPDGQGGVLYGDGAEYVVHRAAPGAPPVLAFRGDGRPAAVTAEDRRQFLDSPRGKAFADYTFPEHKPFFSGLAVDDEGLVWVLRPGESGAQTWEVRRPGGERVGELRVPAGSRVVAVSRRSVYVVEMDDVEVETLHRYRLFRG